MSTFVLFALSTSTALAGIDGGQGSVGETTDLMVTKFGFAVIIGLVAIITILSLLMGFLEQRKDAKKLAAKAGGYVTDKRLGW